MCRAGLAASPSRMTQRPTPAGQADAVARWGRGLSLAAQDAQPLSEGVIRPAAYTLNAAAGDWQFVYVGSMPADPAKLWLLPRLVVKATPVDCEDPDTKNRWVRRHFRLSGEGWNSADMGYSCWGLPNLEIYHP